ncbi:MULTISPECIES: bifunctional DNA-formamidopyrimidine glycosylase/DNA-(apurinic or apyrimidinic site) lyase [unclassified Endozoicomonas]|uniref:bifunctional DNA-formamidopyrimidine glycosylase/DNA-(apurinic or apyrimidinic site) lyase n=1 Tax=unclassified Endozoicomonas TaxID=2644528 RepID=UPI002148644C|nr:MULTISPECIES: bifunctional DNA-formamidopyrimidine glycosylase/DNA-(apurinic or apyrimidinic site) lyase [unclassified Endozoicomonas]
MPELPEVETTRRGIAPHIVGQTVSDVIVRNPQLRWPVSEHLKQHLSGRVIRSVARRAKYLLIRTDAGTLLVHLGMSGSLRILKEPQEARKHDHIDLVFSHGITLRYTDPRRFGAVLWVDDDIMKHDLLSKLGPEPLGDEFTARRLHLKSRGKKQPVKTFIMDNHVVVGVGNIYANEALFKAGIRPDRPCGKISRARYERLTESIKETLAKAIEQGGTTLRDFVGGDGKPGYFKQELAVYGRKGEPCVHCSTPIVEIRLGNRSTCYCKRCQR